MHGLHPTLLHQAGLLLCAAVCASRVLQHSPLEKPHKVMLNRSVSCPL